MAVRTSEPSAVRRYSPGGMPVSALRAGLLCLLLWAPAPGPAYAAEPQSEPGKVLSREELREHHRQLREATPEQRLELFRSLPSEKREQIRRTHRRWKQLKPEGQERLRKNFRRWREFSPGQRHQLKEQYRRWQELDPDQRRRLREELRAHRRWPGRGQPHLRPQRPSSDR